LSDGHPAEAAAEDNDARRTLSVVHGNDLTMSDRPPDFAMQRAVEILASIYERNLEEHNAPPPPTDKPILLFSETIAFDVNTTKKADVERTLGIAFSYPTRGWHTYGVRGANGERLLLSLFYSEGSLASAELYSPRVDRAPKLTPQPLHVRIVPGEIEIGVPITALPEHYRRMTGLPTGPFSEMFEARFPGGSAYAMGNDGLIERLAIYALRD
jgi:hypothetical protein